MSSLIENFFFKENVLSSDPLSVKTLIQIISFNKFNVSFIIFIYTCRKVYQIPIQQSISRCSWIVPISSKIPQCHLLSQ